MIWARHQCLLPAPTMCQERCYMSWLKPWTSRKWTLTVWSLLEANRSLHCPCTSSQVRQEGGPHKPVPWCSPRGHLCYLWVFDPCPMSSPFLSLSVSLTHALKRLIPSSALSDNNISEEWYHLLSTYWVKQLMIIISFKSPKQPWPPVHAPSPAPALLHLPDGASLEKQHDINQVQGPHTPLITAFAQLVTPLLRWAPHCLPRPAQHCLHGGPSAPFQWPSHLQG